MIPAARAAFLRDWRPENYERLIQRMAEACDGPIPFRLSETPCFLPAPLVHQMIESGAELIRQLMDNSAYRAASEVAIPAAYRVPNEPDKAPFVQVDFGLIRNADGQPAPRLVEIQGFPSLYAFQAELSQAYLDAYRLPSHWRYHPSPLSNEGYRQLLGQAIVGGHDPENVILLEIDPDHQKTRCDFVLTERWFGVRPVCITKVRRQGRQLFYERNGRLVPIRRIYNRAIVDELERRNVTAAFDWRQELDVEWAGHPNHYFRISKFSLPYLQHETVPQTHFLHQVSELPANLDRWVLKPLYSFAGNGVRVGPSAEEIAAIPVAERDQWILQERCDFHPFIETPAGPTKAELRIMYLWQEELRAVGVLVRSGRGTMMGVDQNRGLDWVGASAALW
jgi:hypothetical protein